MHREKMKYAITRDVLGAGLLLEMSENDFISLKEARKNLIEVLYLEQKLDVVIENYREFELEILSSTTTSMISRNFEWGYFSDEINKFNRRIINLLTACRLYVDHSCHHISNIFGKKSKQLSYVKGLFSAEYDNKIEYRAMEAIRNYVQHRGFPVHSYSFLSKRVEDKNGDKIQFSNTPYINLAEIEDDKKIKRSVVGELKQIGDKIDLKPFVREYVSSFCHIQKEIRNLVSQDIVKWEASLNNAIDKITTKFPELPLIGLIAVSINDNQTFNEKVPLFVKINEKRKELQRKNELTDSFSRYYVTNEIIG